MREEFILLVKSVDKNRNINMYKLCLSSGVQRSYWFLCRCSIFIGSCSVFLLFLLRLAVYLLVLFRCALLLQDLVQVFSVPIGSCSGMQRSHWAGG